MEKSKTQKQSEQPTPHQRFYTVKNISRIQAGIPHGTGLAVKFVNRNLGKAPPGHSRSPGAPRGHPPESAADPPHFPPLSGREGLDLPAEQAGVSLPPNRTAVKSENKGINNNNKKMKHYKHLIFRTMKKQILFLMVFVLAAFAGVKSYGQTYITVPSGAPTCLTPNELSSTCSTTDALNPAPGVSYPYTVTTSAATNDIRWFVINNEDLKTATPNPVNIIDPTSGILASTSSYIDKSDGSGKYILNIGSGDAYNVNPTSGDGISSGGTTINIAWKNFDGKQPHEILLVAYVQDDAGCSNNIVVWRIIPKNTFTLDIAALGINGSKIADAKGTGIGPCFSPIESATYASVNDVSGAGTLTVNYGENWIFFIVNANNFVDSWMPKFQFTYTGNAADLASASWTYLSAATNSSATWNSIDLTTGVTTVPVIAGGSDANGVPVNAAGDRKVSGSGGECIIVRVRLDYGTTSENSTNKDLTLAVDGVMYDNDNSAGGTFYDNSTLFGDLDYQTCLTDGFTNDWVTETITARPEIDATTPTPLEIKTGDE